MRILTPTQTTSELAHALGKWVRQSHLLRRAKRHNILSEVRRMMTTDKEYIRRFKTLADHLVVVHETEPKRFFFGTFASSSLEDHQDPYDIELTCNSTGCSLGLATTIPMFRDLGLRLFANKHFLYVGLRGHQTNSIYLTHCSKAAEDAAKYIFDVNEEEFEFLFVPITDLDYDCFRWA